MSVNIRDNGGEFRIEIAGSLAGSVVDDVLFAWSAALREDASRRIVVDITQLADYDFQGCTLLQDMHQHGTQIAAGSPQSLVFLNEISGPRRAAPALVRKSPQKDAQVTPIRRARVSALD